MDRVKRIWYLSHMRAAKVQASMRIHAVSPEPPLLAHTSSESRGTFRQKTRSLAPLNGWTCAVKICHDGMLEDTNLLDGARILLYKIQESAGNLPNIFHGSWRIQVSITVMILSLRKDMPGQTVQTHIRLHLEELSDQGLHCLPFRLHRLDSLLYG